MPMGMVMLIKMITWEVKAFDANTTVAASPEAKARYWFALQKNAEKVFSIGLKLTV